MNDDTKIRLQVPGASLYCKVRGAGPVLLILAGGAGDADSSDNFANILLGRFTVVTYDRRGFARSPVTDPTQAIQIHTHSEDLHTLLSALTREPAYVFGSSIGALIGLDLVSHHPEQVSVLLAHEPPVRQILSADELPALGLLSLYRQEGAETAIRKFAAGIGVDLTGPEIHQINHQPDSGNIFLIFARPAWPSSSGRPWWSSPARIHLMRAIRRNSPRSC